MWWRFCGVIVVVFVGRGAGAAGATTAPAAAHLQVGIVQMALAPTLEGNCDRIVAEIPRVAARGARVVVFPEGALRGEGNDDPAHVERAVEAIRRAARESNVYVLFGGASFSAKRKGDVYWLVGVGPDGNEVFRYDKLFDKHDARMPGVFLIDGVPCAAMLCADRWLRGVAEVPVQQGALVSFELSCNFASEWVEPFGWYWYQPRAMSNNVWVVFANTGNRVPGVAETSGPGHLRHGHSAVIAPDGAIVTASHDDRETVVMADLDVSWATRAEALARSQSPALRVFWQAGVDLQQGRAIPAAPPVAKAKSRGGAITLAVAQVVDDVPAMEAMIAQAKSRKADLVAFPARAARIDALDRLRAAARQHGIVVVAGIDHAMQGGRRNSAFVIGADGSVLTRYDQLSAVAPYTPGEDPGAMWFEVKGVPAVITLGRDALWTELSELAAVAGAQVHVHLDRDEDVAPDAALRRLQMWSNLASFETFSATANVNGSAIWDDLSAAEKSRAEVRGLPRPETGAVEVFSPFSANLVARAGAGRQLLVATRNVGKSNTYHPRRTSAINPQMEGWYRLGAATIRPPREAAAGTK